MVACINCGPAVTRRLSQRKRASARLVFGLPRQRFKKPLRMQCDTSRTVLTVYETVVSVHSHEKVWAQMYGKLTIPPCVCHRFQPMPKSWASGGMATKLSSRARIVSSASSSDHGCLRLTLPSSGIRRCAAQSALHAPQRSLGER